MRTFIIWLRRVRTYTTLYIYRGIRNRFVLAFFNIPTLWIFIKRVQCSYMLFKIPPALTQPCFISYVNLTIFMCFQKKKKKKKKKRTLLPQYKYDKKRHIYSAFIYCSFCSIVIVHQTKYLLLLLFFGDSIYNLKTSFMVY